jgi:hypothetical protein
MMASWAPRQERHLHRRARGTACSRSDRGVLRLGRHVVSDRDFVLLAQRLGELEQELAPRPVEETGEDRETFALREVVNARLARDLELLSAAAERSHLSAH